MHRQGKNRWLLIFYLLFSPQITVNVQPKRADRNWRRRERGSKCRRCILDSIRDKFNILSCRLLLFDDFSMNFHNENYTVIMHVQFSMSRQQEKDVEVVVFLIKLMRFEIELIEFVNFILIGRCEKANKRSLLMNLSLKDCMCFSRDA